MTIQETDVLRDKLQNSCNQLISTIGRIHIGSKKIFPFGWRKSAKGRTVWRIVEEIITQNLEKHHKKFNISSVYPSTSEVNVFDMKCMYGNDCAYINIKSAVVGGKQQKDDISKATGLEKFYKEDKSKQLFVATFFIQFNKDMSIELTKAVVFPLAWIPDIYVNPSNNGNLQSSYCKDLTKANRRTNTVFIGLLNQAMTTAKAKKKKSHI